MKCILTGLSLFLLCQNSFAQSYSVGVQSVTWMDASRSNRSIPVEFHYPGTNTAIASDSFGFVVFGHGFDMTIDAYYNYADSLASHGYIVALTSNEGGLSPSHPNLAQDLIYIYNTMLDQSNTNSGSPLYHHVKSRGAIAGHSMGGGSAVLSCQYSDTAACYWTLAEATTTPSSISAATYMRKPYLSFAGSSDCIAPASTNQIPTYDSSRSICKTLIKIANATHCQFANSNIACNFGEGVSGCAFTSLSRSAQTNKVLSFLYPYLDYYLNGKCSAWTSFQSLYAADVTDVLMQSCNNVIPTNQSITGASTFCSGYIDTLTANPAGFSYHWSNNSNTQTISVTSQGVYLLTVSNGICSVPASPFAVTEKYIPATPSAITAPDSVCSASGNIGISIVNDPMAISYSWTLPSGWAINAGSNTNAITVTANSSGGIVSATAQNSCGISTAMQKNIVVVPSVLGLVSTIAGDTVACQGQSALYIASLVSGASAYAWTYPSGWTSTSGTTADTIRLIAGAGAGAITVKAINGCGQGTPSSLTVSVKSPPTAGSISGTDSICITTVNQLSFGLPTISGADSIYWSVPTGWSVISGQGSATVSINNNYSGGVLNATAYNVCGISNANPLTLTVVDTPQATISRQHDTLIASVGVSYQWYDNGSAISGANAQSFIPTQNGNYSVQITNATNCNGNSAIITFTTLSLWDLSGDSEITISPNPSSSGSFHLSISEYWLGADIKIQEVLGREIYQSKLMETHSIIDLGKLNKGIYIATIMMNGIFTQQKLVVY